MKGLTLLNLAALFAVATCEIRAPIHYLSYVYKEENMRVDWDKRDVIKVHIDRQLRKSIRDKIIEILDFYSDATCLKFDTSRIYNNSEYLGWQENWIPYLRFGDDYNGCFTNSIGRTYDNYVNLGPSCARSVAHEVGHALGLIHTHTRSDRDQFVTVNLPSSCLKRTNCAHQFNNKRMFKTFNYGIPYDYGSAMHYSPVALSDNRDELVIGAHKDPLRQFTMGGNPLSITDLVLINKRYNCEVAVKTCGLHGNVKCQNGGFVNPNDCTRCVCPFGLTGSFCTERDKGRFEDGPCGADLEATLTWKTVKGNARTEEFGSNIDYVFKHCHWLIKAPANMKIMLKFVSVESYSNESLSCRDGGTELKIGDFHLGGFKFCRESQIALFLDHEFVTHSNLALINLFVHFGATEFEIKYKLVSL
ncbi:hypothetical protein L596_001368 [Steinernema carpocapsae]|uniref:Metalloendopeptidase n=1 Tax=Steinernema carpocapsae TaxID=34508 RepID=A0A4U8ULK2_STECR|nr:hypothetical protein L596_001368 [Steinernema carpocapsae]